MKFARALRLTAGAPARYASFAALATVVAASSSQCGGGSSNTPPPPNVDCKITLTAPHSDNDDGTGVTVRTVKGHKMVTGIVWGYCPKKPVNITIAAQLYWEGDILERTGAYSGQPSEAPFPLIVIGADKCVPGNWHVVMHITGISATGMHLQSDVTGDPHYVSKSDCGM